MVGNPTSECTSAFDQMIMQTSTTHPPDLDARNMLGGEKVQTHDGTGTCTQIECQDAVLLLAFDWRCFDLADGSIRNWEEQVQWVNSIP